MANEMVERVARAIGNERQNACAGSNEYKTAPVIVMPSDVRMARAAIAALREPTEEMINAGNDAGLGEVPYPETAWVAMIDKALEEA